MTLVSFSSGEDALSNDVEYITLLARKVLKIRRSAFFLDTRYILPLPSSLKHALWWADSWGNDLQFDL